MVDILMRNQRLIMIQFVVFSVLFGSVIVMAAVIYSKTTVYDMEKQQMERDITTGFERLGESTSRKGQ